jgi:hypothetical protein
MSDWENRLNEIIETGTPRQVETARWKMGYKTGLRVEQKRLLDILEYYQVLYWDDAQNVWLNMATGKPVYGLDWREENLDVHKQTRKNQETNLQMGKAHYGLNYANA